MMKSGGAQVNLAGHSQLLGIKGTLKGKGGLMASLAGSLFNLLPGPGKSLPRFNGVLQQLLKQQPGLGAQATPKPLVADGKPLKGRAQSRLPVALFGRQQTGKAITPALQRGEADLLPHELLETGALSPGILQVGIASLNVKTSGEWSPAGSSQTASHKPGPGVALPLKGRATKSGAARPVKTGRYSAIMNGDQPVKTGRATEGNGKSQTGSEAANLQVGQQQPRHRVVQSMGFQVNGEVESSPNRTALKANGRVNTANPGSANVQTKVKASKSGQTGEQIPAGSIVQTKVRASKLGQTGKQIPAGSTEGTDVRGTQIRGQSRPPEARVTMDESRPGHGISHPGRSRPATGMVTTDESRPGHAPVLRSTRVGQSNESPNVDGSRSNVNQGGDSRLASSRVSSVRSHAGTRQSNPADQPMVTREIHPRLSSGHLLVEEDQGQDAGIVRQRTMNTSDGKPDGTKIRATGQTMVQTKQESQFAKTESPATVTSEVRVEGQPRTARGNRQRTAGRRVRGLESRDRKSIQNPQGEQVKGTDSKPASHLTGERRLGITPDAQEHPAVKFADQVKAGVHRHGEQAGETPTASLAAATSLPLTTGSATVNVGHMARTTALHYFRYLSGDQQHKVFSFDGGALGNMKITFVENGAGMALQIVVESSAAQQMLQRALPNLEQAWQQQGLDFADVGVEVGNSRQGQESFDGEHANVGRTPDQSSDMVNQTMPGTHIIGVKNYGYNTVDFVA